MGSIVFIVLAFILFFGCTGTGNQPTVLEYYDINDSYTNYSKKIVECNAMTDSQEKDTCYSVGVIWNLERAQCSEITDEKWKAKCYAETAESIEDLGACYQFAGKNKDECIVGGMYSLKVLWSVECLPDETSVYCEQVNDSSRADDCWLNAAEITSDPSACENIEDNLMLISCYDWIIYMNEDPNICEEMPAWNKDKCIVSAVELMASRIVNAREWPELYEVNYTLEELEEYCTRVIDSGYMKDCQMALVTIDPQELRCEQFTEMRYKDNCYYQMAYATKNTTWCDKIQNLEDKDICKWG